MAFEHDPEPVVGGVFNGTKIVSMQVEESQRGHRWKKRFIMTLASGIIAIEDRIVSKTPPSDDPSKFDTPYNDIAFPNLPTRAQLDALERQREKEDREERKRQKNADRIKKEEERDRRRRIEKQQREEEEEEEERRRRRAKEEAAAAAAAEAERLEVEKRARKKCVSWGPITILVLPDGDPYFPPDSPKRNDARAVWKFPKDWDKPTDAAFWRPHEITLFAPGDDPTNHSSNEDQSLDDSLSLSGVWGYVPGSERDNGMDGSDGAVRVGNGSSLNDVGDLWVYPPGTDPPEDFPKHGVYIISPRQTLEQGWPPQVDEEKKELAHVGYVNVPPAFVGNSNAKALPMTVYPRNWQKEKVTDTDTPPPIIGEWTFSPGEEQDDDDWAPQDAMMYPPGHSPPSSQGALPQGLWATTEDLNPYSKDWAPPSVMVFPPGTDSETIKDSDNFGRIVATGTWCFPPGSLKKDWPPPTNKEVRQLRKAGRLTIPPIFQQSGGVPVPIRVYSQRQKPTSNYGGGGHDDNANHPVGRWSYPRSEEAEDDEDWEPQDVLLYAPGEEAPSSYPPHENEFSRLPKGLWTIVEDDPDVVKVYPPGMEPDDEEKDDDRVIASGEWTYPVGSLTKEWPPPTKEEASRLRSVGKLPVWSLPGQSTNWRPQNAQVFPHRALPSHLSSGREGSNSNDDCPRGVWKYKEEDEPEDLDDWEAQDVVMYPSSHEPNVGNGQPSGFWGLHKDASPDDDGNWLPSDLLFYPPAEKPDEDCAVQGKWAYHPGNTDTQWPPRTKQATAELRKIGKVPKWNPSGQGDCWKPQGATVFPKRSAPSSTPDKSTVGIWKYTAGKEPKDLSDWDSQEVMIYPKDLEPENLAEKPHGLWGIRIDAEPDGVTGEWKPDDIWFYGPGEQPETDCAVQGKWTFPPSQLDVHWPPKKSEFLSPQRNVGKLKIPNMFSTASQTPSAFSPRTPLSHASGHSTLSSNGGNRRHVPTISPRRQISRDDTVIDTNSNHHNMESPTKDPRSSMSLYQSALDYTPTKDKKKLGTRLKK